MKQLTLIIASILFSTLFYNQNIGLNLCLFSFIAIVLLYLFNRDKFRNKMVGLFAFIYSITALLVFFINSNLSILANIIAFVTLVGMVSNSQVSIFISWLNGLYTSIAGIFHRNFEQSETSKELETKKTIDYLHWLKLIGIPGIFLLAFILLYQNGNPIFDGLIKNINFEFIDFQWILFSLLGYFLLSNIIEPVLVDSATSADLSHTNQLKNNGLRPEEIITKEKQLGIVLLGLLNLLITFYLITDFIFLYDTSVSIDASLTEQVHSGVYALIASILIAISILLFVFRGDLNFYKKNASLKQLSFLWIFLNAQLVFTVVLKNGNYVATFGLTYKRIGVYIYALLTLIGLCTTFLKVLNIKNL